MRNCLKGWHLEDLNHCSTLCSSVLFLCVAQGSHKKGQKGPSWTEKVTSRGHNHLCFTE